MKGADNEYLISATTFIDAMLNAIDDEQTRISLRNEFSTHGLEDLIPEIAASANDALITQLEHYEESAQHDYETQKKSPTSRTLTSTIATRSLKLSRRAPLLPKPSTGLSVHSRSMASIPVGEKSENYWHVLSAIAAEIAQQRNPKLTQYLGQTLRKALEELIAESGMQKIQKQITSLENKLQEKDDEIKKLKVDGTKTIGKSLNRESLIDGNVITGLQIDLSKAPGAEGVPASSVQLLQLYLNEAILNAKKSRGNAEPAPPPKNTKPGARPVSIPPLRLTSAVVACF